MKIAITPDSEVLFEKISDLGIEIPASGSPADFYCSVDKYRVEVIRSFIEKGVRFISFDGVVISPLAEIGPGTVIHPNTEIRHGVKVGTDCVIGPCSVLENSAVGDRCVVNATQVYGSRLENDVKIGPFCHIRPGSLIRSGVKIGDFVEVKNSDIGRDTHASHLTYIGDSDVGERVNIGCGVVTCNYDGKRKFRTTIGNDVFVGCNTNLVAPVTLADNSYTAAGSTITEDVPAEALGIARARQVNKERWKAKRDAD